MTENPECVTREDTLQRAASLMRDRDVGAIPVVSDAGSRRLVGIVTDRDIAVRHVAEGHNGECTVEEAMSGSVATAAMPIAHWIQPSRRTGSATRSASRHRPGGRRNRRSRSAPRAARGRRPRAASGR